MPRKIKKFVMFFVIGGKNDGVLDHGNSVYKSKSKKLSIKDIRKFEKIIENESEDDITVVVTNYKRLKGAEKRKRKY